MELDLTGQSVTQSLSIFSEAVDACTDPELVIRTDNEVIKLNLYNLIHKKGMRCKMDRKGRTYTFTVKTGRGGKKGGPPPSQTAFPVGHISGTKDAPSPNERPGRRRRARAKKSEPVKAPAPSAPISAPKPEPSPTTVAHPQAAQPHWLVIQQDQIGQKDVALGVELLETFLENIDPSRTTGVFLTHRGVRILDQNYQNGRLLRALMGGKVKIVACAQSLTFYQLMDKVPPTVEVAPIKELHKLAATAGLTWV